eukprot:CAMPEP_0194499298 /NCGR_PEP_ID=MMETSP0253-20130528/15644_1 /TAXON_ID=2966 /ORGANISM="Noctiluca scintillans" /LENGTH=223 /DNA_ID=CAMNT_0039341033 /DNA_START=26 /DNA_END=694 /DNA_ORIENTATION=+
MTWKSSASTACRCVLRVIVFLCLPKFYSFGVFLVASMMKGLHDDVVDGFHSALKFAHFTDDSATVKSAAVSALALCGIDASEDCDGSTYSGRTSGNVGTCGDICDTSSQLETIQNAFDNSLTTIQEVVNDVYFGTDDMGAAASQLNEISDVYEEVLTNLSCLVQGAQYCLIYDKAESLTEEVDTVLAQIDKFTGGDVITCRLPGVSYGGSCGCPHGILLLLAA